MRGKWAVAAVAVLAIGWGAVGSASAIPSTTTTTAVSCTPNPVEAGTSSTCTATVTGQVTAPTGTVTFTASGGTGTFTPNSPNTCTLSPVDSVNSSCTIAYVPNTAPKRGVKASYGGDPTHGKSASLTYTLNVSRRPTTVDVVCTLTVIVPTQSTDCTATVTDSESGNQSVPLGSVAWTNPTHNGRFTPQTCTLSGATANSASCTTTFQSSVVPADRNTLTMTARYIPGEAVHAGSTGQETVKETKRATSVTVSCVDSTVVFDTATNCSVTVTDTSPMTPSAPTGTVALTASGGGSTFTPSSPCTLSPTSSTTSSCNFQYTPSGTGPHRTIRGYYSGDSIHLAQGSNGFVITTAQPT